MLDRFRLLASALSGSRQLQSTLILAVANGFANIFNYGYQFAMARLLTPVEFGSLASLVAVFTILGVVSPAFQISAAKFTAVALAERGRDQIRGIWLGLLRTAGVFGIIGAVMLLATLPWISSFLRVEDLSLWLLVASTLLVAFALPVNMGVLQGMQRFELVALGNMATPLIKVVVGAILVMSGFGIAGAFAPILIGLLAVFALTFLPLRRLPSGERSSGPGRVMGYMGWSTLAFGGFVALISMDMILAKHYLSEVESGYYGAVAVLGRIILFAPAAASIVMLPKAAGLRSSESGRRLILRLSLAYTLVIGGVLVGAYWLFTPQIVRLALGAQYLAITPVVTEFALGMVLMAATFVLMHYYLAIDRNRVGLALVLAAGVHLSMALAYHDNLAAFTHVRLASSAFALVVIVVYGQRPFLYHATRVALRGLSKRAWSE